MSEEEDVIAANVKINSKVIKPEVDMSDGGYKFNPADAEKAEACPTAKQTSAAWRETCFRQGWTIAQNTIQRQRKELKDKDEAFRIYARHLASCGQCSTATKVVYGARCTCGFEQALKGSD